jgi:hypothetical protein
LLHVTVYVTSQHGALVVQYHVGVCRATMLRQAGSYKHIAAGLPVLHDLTIFVRQARCDELGCNVHPSMPQTWLVLYVARRTVQYIPRCNVSHCVAHCVCSTSCRFLCSGTAALRSHRLAGLALLLALLLALPAHVAALTAITDANFKTAADAWLSDSATATTTYGLIADWNTAAVSNIARVCIASVGHSQRGGHARFSTMNSALHIIAESIDSYVYVIIDRRLDTERGWCMQYFRGAHVCGHECLCLRARI